MNQITDNGLGTDEGSLSWAITQVNGHPGGNNTIVFDLAGSGHQITVSGTLPNIEHALTTIQGIDGTTGQRTQIVKAPAGAIFNALTYDGNAELSGWLEVYDLEISGFQGNAIRIASLSDNDVVTIVNSSLHDNAAAGISSVDIPTGATGRFDIRSNYIYGNGSTGILIGGPTSAVPSTTRSTIGSNTIGRTPQGAAAANLGAGIQLGTGVARFDVTSNNIENVSGSEDGIRLLSTAGTGNKLVGNKYRNVNGMLIDLVGPTDLPSGETPNDGGDGDGGPNNLLNKPVLHSELPRIVGANWSIPFNVEFGTPAASYNIEFYRYNNSTSTWSPVTPLFTTGVVSTQLVTASFASSVFSAGDKIAVIAYGTNSNPDTSEFSNIITLDAAPPQVTDVQLDSTTWTSAPLVYSYQQIGLAGGNYIKPIFTQNVNQLKVLFSEAVVQSTLTSANVTLKASYGDVISASVISLPTPTFANNTATWALPSVLGAGKYRLEIATGVTDIAGKALDGEWTNIAGPANGPRTYDYYADDVPTASNTFPSGNDTPGGLFGFDFSILPGDYNQDGVVQNSGLANDKNSVADGDGDGIAGTAADLALVDSIVSSGVGLELPLRARDGDYRRESAGDNDIVGAEDYTIWRSTYGNEISGELDGYLEADGNGNGIVDTADYNIWRNNVGKRSIWAGATGSGSGSGASLPVFDPFNVPRVANVIVSGSLSMHPPFSFDSVDGSGQQLTTVPVGGADTISIVFTEDVNVQADFLQLVGLRTANRPVMADFNYDIATMTASWRFTGWVLGDQYALMLSDAVTDIEGNHLDGDWKNPLSRSTVNASISTFPSGDGYAGGEFQFVMTLLPGDADLNGIVNTVDYAIFGSHYGMTNALFTLGDFNGDGQVSYGGDGSLMYANWNLNLSGPVTILADLNGDKAVDALDEAIISSHSGMPNPTQADGDLNHNGQIGLDDLDLMFAQYGLKLTLLS